METGSFLYHSYQLSAVSDRQIIKIQDTEIYNSQVPKIKNNLPTGFFASLQNDKKWGFSRVTSGVRFVKMGEFSETIGC